MRAGYQAVRIKTRERTMTEIILRAEHLTKTFSTDKGGFTAVRDVSFEVKKGEALGIVGESGSGKTTAARLVTGLIRPTEGKIFLMGKEISKAGGRELRKAYRNMQMIFQTPTESFDPRYTLGNGIGESLRNAGMSRKETGKRVRELLVQCGLTPEFEGKYPHQVSGGECQRAAIARALAIRPKLLVCDEPTSALDVTVQKQILDLLLQLKSEGAGSFLFISHDLALVPAFWDRVLVMDEGRIVERGTSDEIISSPREEYTRRLVDSVL